MARKKILVVGLPDSFLRKIQDLGVPLQVKNPVAVIGTGMAMCEKVVDALLAGKPVSVGGTDVTIEMLRESARWMEQELGPIPTPGWRNKFVWLRALLRL